MSIIYRITLSFIVISLVVFLVGGLITYRVMKGEIDAEQRRFLVEREGRVTNFISRTQPDSIVQRPKILIVPLEGQQIDSQVFTDTVVMHSDLERLEPHLKLIATKQVDGNWYRIEIFDVIVEADDVVDGVVESLVKTYLLLLISVVILAFFSSYYLLRPFKQTLEKIKSFSLQSSEDITFSNSQVSEFRRLNSFLDEMTRKIKSDYQTLKEFSENASHEIQTPIAVAQGKLDLLIQNETLDEDQLKLITSTQKSLSHLRNLAKALALLTKLDNKEFVTRSSMNFSSLVKRKVHEIEDLAELQGIKTTSTVQPDISLMMNETLAEVLVNNLVGNALKHNLKNGFIEIFLDNTCLKISNSGKKLDFDTNEVFQRFKKGNNESLGLGMAIVKKICVYYGLDVEYENENEHHTVTISFATNTEIKKSELHHI